MPRRTTAKKRTSKVLDVMTMQSVIAHLCNLGYTVANELKGGHLVKVELARKNQRCYIVGRC